MNVTHGTGEAHRHLPVTVYTRPWWNWFRKTYQALCWKCEDVLDEGNASEY